MPRPSTFAGGAQRAPHPALRPYVTSITGYHDVLDPHAVHYGVASATVTVILAFDEPLDSGWLATPARHTTYWSMVAGLHLAPALIRTHGFQHGIQLSLTPAGVRALLGVPASAVAGDMAALPEVDGAVRAGLHARLWEQRTWLARFDLLEQHLLATLTARPAPTEEVAAELRQAWRLLARSRGTIRIDQVGREVGWSRRRLADRFRAEFGVRPKQAARLLRLDHARSLAREGRPLAQVAASSGYADQAHLSREWRDLAGAPPAESLAAHYLDDPHRHDTFLQDAGLPSRAR